MAPLGFTNPLDKGNKVEYNGKSYTVSQNICGSTILVGTNGEMITVPTRELTNSSVYNVYEKQIASCKEKILSYEQKNKEIEAKQDIDKKNRSIYADKLAIFKREHSLCDIFNNKENNQKYINMKNDYWGSVFSYTRNSNSIQCNLSCIRDLNENISFYKNLG